MSSVLPLHFVSQHLVLGSDDPFCPSALPGGGRTALMGCPDALQMIDQCMNMLFISTIHSLRHLHVMSGALAPMHCAFHKTHRSSMMHS